jgi:DNA polymerase-3 subunit epsilon
MINGSSRTINGPQHIPAFVTQLSGITNEMIQRAPALTEVMREAARVVGAPPVVARNTSFDRKLWRAELQRLALDADSPFACTMLLARCL